MQALPWLLVSLVLHLAAALIVWQHLKRQRKHRHHHAALPVIGSDLHLTEALHLSMARKQPGTDWLNPTTMRAKLSAWRRHSQAAEAAARNA